MLIVLAGLPGVGKSAVADRLATALDATVLSVDPIESAIVRAGVAPSFETGLAAYLVAETVADGNLAAGRTVIVDAVNAVEPAREMWRSLAGRRGVAIRWIEVTLADDAVHRRRLAGRDRGLAIAEPAWGDVDRRRLEWAPWREIDERIAVDGAADLATTVERLVLWLGSDAAPGA